MSLLNKMINSFFKFNLCMYNCKMCNFFNAQCKGCTVYWTYIGWYWIFNCAFLFHLLLYFDCLCCLIRKNSAADICVNHRCCFRYVIMCVNRAASQLTWGVQPSEGDKVFKREELFCDQFSPGALLLKVNWSSLRTVSSVFFIYVFARGLM